MLEPSRQWFQQIPKWIWWSFCPYFGGLAIAYAGYKSKTPPWYWLGLAITGTSLVSSVFLSSGLPQILWLVQIGIAFYLKPKFLAKTYPHRLPFPHDLKMARLIAINRDQLDINTCSVDQMVYDLGLPLVYAQDIDSLRREGYRFTYLEELSDLAGLPESYLHRIEPMIIFTYDPKYEVDISWRRLNSLSYSELVQCGIEPQAAEKIIEERQKQGQYRSLVEVKRRTGLPLNAYRHLMD